MKSEEAIKFRDCPPGLFTYKGGLFYKSEYGDEAFCVSSGEIFWGGAQTKEERAELLVYPIEYETAEDALREKVERDKGCEYCNGTKRIRLKNWTSKVAYQQATVEFGFKAIDAVFCPVCGRPLKEATDGNK